MVGQTPDDFLFGLKVTDAITIKKYPNLDRFGQQAGKPNANFLNADLFTKAFLRPCEAVRSAIGLFMFEFFRLAERLRAWPRLHRRRGQIPGRTPEGLAVWRGDEEPELAQAGILRVPGQAPGRARLQFLGGDAPVGEQMALPGSRTNPHLVAARFLLKPGRKYEQAVKAFEPYDNYSSIEFIRARRAGAAIPPRRRGSWTPPIAKACHYRCPWH
jgi:hypothetical protein